MSVGVTVGMNIGATVDDGAMVGVEPGGWTAEAKMSTAKARRNSLGFIGRSAA